MDLSKFTFSKKYIRNSVEYSLAFDFDLKTLTGRNSKTFEDYASLLFYLQNNQGKKICITLDTTGTVTDFNEEGDILLINLKAYQEFCKKIGQSGKNRTQAFLAQKLTHYSANEKSNIIQSSTETEILERVKNFTDSEKAVFIEGLNKIDGINLPSANSGNISNEDFLRAFSAFLSDPAKRDIVVGNYSQIQISILEEYKMFLENNLDKNETFIQDWIDGKISNEGLSNNLEDEERKKVTKSRCLIFGLEFISHKREGQISSKEFDILTKISQGKNDYVLIELKSPNKNTFKIVEKDNPNGGKSTEYHLSDDISRAIPQISDYRSLLENATETEWQKIGLPKGKISKCLIIIGTKTEDPVWLGHFSNLRRNLSSTIEILTYTDLIDKLDITIKNLRENL